MARPPKIPDGLKLRGKTYYAWLTYKGQTIRKALSKSREAASDILNDMIARIDRGDYGFVDNDAAIEDIRKQYVAFCKQNLKPSTVWQYEHSLTTILTKIAVERVSQITERDILTYRQNRLDDGLSPRTVNMEVNALSTMLRYAVRRKIIATNPIHDLRRLPHDNPKSGRALTNTEVAALLAKSPQPWRDVWHAYVVTGMRLSELGSLKWRDIDWEAREIIVRATVAKNHTTRRIPIENGLWGILKKRAADKDSREPGRGRTPRITELIGKRFSREHVFTTAANTPLTHRSGVYFALMRCCKLAGIETRTLDESGQEIEHVDVHSLRRTFATSLIAGGADPKSVQDLMGHKTLAMTMNLYAKLHTSTRWSAVAMLPYGTGAEQPTGIVAGTIRMIKEPEAQKMRTTGQPVVVAAT